MIQNTELLACKVSLRYPGDSEVSDGDSDNDGGGVEEDDENSVTNSISPVSTTVLLTIVKKSTIY